ncbi:chromate transporter [Oscillospiraceae bacterium NSJ-54]|uniref:Chromate transporter n=2 Tax=Zongyangia hominis TaxID=2763677 RepID=A0A926IA11_9FIRM|nr:chromate transporter [Zongyangia hominis]
MQAHSKRHKILLLFLTFLKIGAFTFGGGYAMIALMQREVVEKRHWITDEDIMDIITIAESTPGVIAVNSATFIGYKTAGFWGAFFATLGVTLPSFVVISVISLFFVQFKSLKIVAYAFEGIRAGIAVLIVSAVIKLSKYCPKDLFSFLLAALAFFASAFFDVSSIYLLLTGMMCGIVYQVIKVRRTSTVSGKDGDGK